ncbi:MAG: hypothetical protein HYX76_15565 [Acidobacteria bacterium]|nr:hypothetical protein [Acidobacteriota bacterium]
METGRFTVGVFQDAQWAERGLNALKHHDFPVESLSVIARDTPEAAGLIDRALVGPPERLEVQGVGTVVAKGPLVEAIGGNAELAKTGMAPNMRRVGFQAHDGYIFETLTARGGVLVAVRTEPRAADALAVLHAYGGGNAAIGAWTGRV